ncbi:MAG: replication-associated recombination protein A [Nitrospirae bacterium]|nr:MAG: replication-associated recombination protein A [Nitrospirota bacterium]
MQPEDFSDFLGQEHLLGQHKPLRRLIEEDKMVSVIFYGPPGTGKTALAHIIARKTRADFISINAVTAGIKDIRDAVSSIRGEKTILFIDEIHRFNKIQQDALLPHIEKGELILIGASTQNPFFALVPALSSRSLIFQFQKIPPEGLKAIIRRALQEKRGLGEYAVALDDEAADFIAAISEGDARKALNTLELAFLSSQDSASGKYAITLAHIKDVLQNKSLYYDEDDHYDTISAFIKSMRGSDPDATVYWLARMIESGEDPLFIARRIVICASEDVGNADPQALTLATSAMMAVERIGMPEGRIPLSQAALYVAAAPKSNAAYAAIDNALGAIRTEPLQQVPPHLRDAHYSGAKRLGAGAGYQYPHDFEHHYVKQEYLNTPKSFYTPSSEGYERIIKSRLHKRRSTTDV